MIAGSAAGHVAGRSAWVNAYINPWLIIALNLPVLLVIILFYIWIGLNVVAAVLAVIIAKVPMVMMTIREDARALDPGLEDVAVVCHLPLLRRLRQIGLCRKVLDSGGLAYDRREAGSRKSFSDRFQGQPL